MLRPTTNSVVVHHSVIPQERGKIATMRVIRSAHKKNGLAYDGDIAYHKVIGNDWVAIGRPVDTVGYHSGNYKRNLNSLAVCLNGNFNEDVPNAYQKKELKKTLEVWLRKYGIDENNVILHRDVKATACPGKNVTHQLIDQLLADDMADQKLKERNDALHAQVKRLLGEVKKRDKEVDRWKTERFKWFDIAEGRQAEVVRRDGRITEIEGQLSTCQEREVDDVEVEKARQTEQKRFLDIFRKLFGL